jgi:DNA-binding response OmpR family regulator
MDDDPIILTFLTNLLQDKGYTVHAVEDGSEGILAARRLKPDLIISDLIMPYADGYEILRELKRDPALRRIPVMVVSMKDKESDIVRGFELGAEDYVVKPFGAHELVARVRRLLVASKKAAAAVLPAPASGSGSR